jgi:membrane protease YdiL (CAAX protease family)
LDTLLRFLTQPRQPLWKFCALAYLTALAPSLALYSCAYFVVGAVGADAQAIQAPPRAASLSEFLGAVIFAPLVETAILGLLLRGLLSVFKTPLLVAALSALLWGAMHATFGLLWFFGTVWSFFVFSCAYVAWRQRSLHEAYISAAVPHAMVNLTAMLAIALGNAA